MLETVGLDEKLDFLKLIKLESRLKKLHRVIDIMHHSGTLICIMKIYDFIITLIVSTCFGANALQAQAAELQKN